MTVTIVNKTQDKMDKIVAGLPTKSAKIRALGKAGYARADIARYLRIRYQHVRNVLVQAEEKEKREQRNNVTDTPPTQVWAQVGPEGRIVIPAAYRKFLGIEKGGHVLMLLEQEEVRLIGRDGAIARAQELVAPFIKDESTSAEAFLAERRREARHEASSG